MSMLARGVVSQTQAQVHAQVHSHAHTQFESSFPRRHFSDKKEEPEAAAAQPAEEAADVDVDAKVEVDAPPTEEPAVTNEMKIQALENQVKDLRNQLLRSLAEQENTRSIAKRDIQAGKDFALKSFAKSLLDVSDNLSRALDAVPPTALQGEDESSQILKTLYEGIDMTDKGLTKAFLMNGLTKFAEQPGDVFNPEQHQALFEYPDPEKEAGTIGQVMKVGFMLNNRVLRPAEVGIVKKP
jgi:molecular chaperone GrpE